MKRHSLVVAAAFLAALLVGGSLASAQSASAKIDFPFVAGGKEMAAGTYIIETPAAGPVVLKGSGSANTSVFLPVITKLGRHDKDKEPELVFDKIDGKYLLSEIWGSGGDGFLVLITKTPHEHAVAGGPTARK